MVSVVAGDVAFERRASRAGRKRLSDVRNRTQIYDDLSDIDDANVRSMVARFL